MNKVVKEVMQNIIDNGFEVYLVGGYVRDYILGIESYDYDLATSAKPVDLIRLYPEAKATNYGSVILKYQDCKFEITTFRIEKNYSLNRFPTISYTDSYKKDLVRRDFTINSLYMDINENVIDEVNGIEDIHKRILKMIGDPNKKLEEDALRILRTIRFATIYNFDIDLSLDEAMFKYAYLVLNLSFDRKKEELDKVFASKNIERGLYLIKKYHLDKYLNIKIDNIKLTNNYLGIWAQIECDTKYPFLKNEKIIINKIKKYLVKDIMNPHVLYNAGLYIASIVGQIKGISIKKINLAYTNLAIKQKSDIDITSEDIIKTLNISPGKIISNIYDDVAYQIINNNLDNNKDSILKYIVNKYK